MSAFRKAWMKRQTELRNLLEGSTPKAQGLEILLSQHAMLHSARMANSEPWSYEDEILDDLSETQWRSIPPGSEHSIAWMIWHIARIEDTAMNILVAGSSQVFEQERWAERLGIPSRSSGNEMDAKAIAALSKSVKLPNLRAYRTAVGQRTRQIIQGLELDDLKQKVNPERIQLVLQTGAVDETAREITNYWSKRTTAGLLLMPATRHNFVHLNEAARLAKRIR